jgi:hypothetical protein
MKKTTTRPLEGGELVILNCINGAAIVILFILGLMLVQAILFTNPLATIIVLLLIIILNEGTKRV